MKRKLMLVAGGAICVLIAAGLGTVYILNNPQLRIIYHKKGMDAAAATILRDDNLNLADAEEADETFK